MIKPPRCSLFFVLQATKSRGRPGDEASVLLQDGGGGGGVRDSLEG